MVTGIVTDTSMSSGIRPPICKNFWIDPHRSVPVEPGYKSLVIKMRELVDKVGGQTQFRVYTWARFCSVKKQNKKNSLRYGIAAS